MGAIYSIPLCAKEKDPASGEINNNQPMPTLQHDSGVVVSVQPLATAQQPVKNSLANPTCEELGPNATSTPRSQRQLSPASSALSEDDPSSLDLDVARVIDEEVLETSTERDHTSDSGLEQSSSDEPELGPPSRQFRPGTALDKSQPPPLDSSNEGSGNGTLPLGNHDTCDEDEDDEDDVEEEDPLERCPEPTVPDERVDSTSSSDRERASASPQPKEKAAKDTTAAITDLLADIVSGDRPSKTTEVDVNPGFAERMHAEAAIR